MDKINKIICYIVVLLMLIVTVYILNSNDIALINYIISISLNLLILYNELFIIHSGDKKYSFILYVVIILSFYIWFTMLDYVVLMYLLIGIFQFIRFYKNKLYIIFVSFLLTINLSLYIKIEDKLLFYKKIFISDFIFILASIFIYLLVYMIDQNDKLEKSKEKFLYEKIKSEYAYEQLNKAYGELENYTILKERNRIAREMHDTIGHNLTLSLVQLENFSRVKVKDEDKEEFKEIINAVREVLYNIRTTTHAIKEEVDLWLEIDKLIDNINKKGIVSINYSRDNIDNVLSEKVKCIYNIIQESITNGIKHGQANAFIIAIKNIDDNIVVRIINNGIGSSAYKKGFGLSSMEERISSFNGSLDIDTAIGEGFTVTAYIPKGENYD